MNSPLTSKLPSTASIEALTAPQLSCPSTRINGTFSTSNANSSEPTIVLAITCPTFRTTKRSPSPTSKIISAPSLESEQPNRAAKGCCAAATDFLSSASCLGCSGVPATKFSLPRTRAAHASLALVGRKHPLQLLRNKTRKLSKVGFVGCSIDYNRGVSEAVNHGVVLGSRRVSWS